jgi:hypothetical protein
MPRDQSDEEFEPSSTELISDEEEGSSLKMKLIPPSLRRPGRRYTTVTFLSILVSNLTYLRQELSTQEFDLSIYDGLVMWVDNLPSRARGRRKDKSLRGKSVLSKVKKLIAFLCEKYQLKSAEEAERYLLVENPPALLAYCNCLTEREVGPSTVANHLGELKDWLNFVAAERRLYCKANALPIYILFFI